MKNYLIIGGSSGIGKELSQILAENDNKVFATYNSNPTSSNSLPIEYSHLNVMDDEMDFDHLPEIIDGIAYCPGTINLKPFARIKPEEFVQDFNLQVVGAIKVIQALLPRLKKADHPAIVLFSTVATQIGFNFHSQVSTSKGAIEGLTRSLAAELAPRIRVNAIAPSITDTPLASALLNTDDKRNANAQRHPLKSIGSPTDIAEMAAFLLSDKSKWTSGQIMHVDGGMSSIRV